MKSEEEDPFSSIAEACLLPSSQEEHLRKGPFAFSTSNNDSPSQSQSSEMQQSGVVMLSLPPDSTNSNDDVYHTPPEDSLLPASQDQNPLSQYPDTLPVGSQMCTAVDLSNTDSSFGLRGQNGDTQVIQDTAFAHQGQNGDTQVIHTDTYESSGSGLEGNRNVGVEGHVGNYSGTKGKGVCVSGLETDSNVGVGGHFGHVSEGSSSGTKGNGVCGLGSGLETDGIGGHVGNLRVLPQSISGAAVEENVPAAADQEISFLHVLKMIADRREAEAEAAAADDDDDENVDLVETAKSVGFVFPRPRWWLPEGFPKGD